MKASDLRIGNIIHHPTLGGSGYYFTNHRTINDLASSSDSLDYKPIPLTDDWLIKFGFTHENTIGGYSRWSHKEMKLLDMKFYNESYPPRPIKYVHQLQNLYHALTGKELILQL